MTEEDLLIAGAPLKVALTKKGPAKVAKKVSPSKAAKEQNQASTSGDSEEHTLPIA